MSFVVGCFPDYFPPKKNGCLKVSGIFCLVDNISGSTKTFWRKSCTIEQHPADLWGEPAGHPHLCGGFQLFRAGFMKNKTRMLGSIVSGHASPTAGCGTSVEFGREQEPGLRSLE